MRRGYIRAYRKTLDSPIWQYPPLYYKVWCYILYTVNWELTLIPGQGNMGVWLSPGMMPCSADSIAEGLKWRDGGRGRRYHRPARNTIDKIIYWLNSQNMIQLNRDHIGTLIIVNNWHSYQSSHIVIAQPLEQPCAQPLEHSEAFKELKEVKERKNKTSIEIKPTFQLPDWIPQDAWDGFEEMRKKTKHPLTDRARKLIITELARLKELGYDPGKVLDRSTTNNWRDVYQLKENPVKDIKPVTRLSPEPPVR